MESFLISSLFIPDPIQGFLQQRRGPRVLLYDSGRENRVLTVDKAPPRRESLLVTIALTRQHFLY